MKQMEIPGGRTQLRVLRPCGKGYEWIITGEGGLMISQSKFPEAKEGDIVFRMEILRTK